MRSFLCALATLASLAHAQVALVDRIVAVVDDHAITRSAVEQRARPFLAKATTDPQREAVRQQVLDALIEEWLIRGDAARVGISTTDEEVSRALRDVASANHFTLAQLDEAAKQEGFEPAEYRDSVRRQLLELKWLNLAVARDTRPADAKDYPAWMSSERTRLVAQLKTRSVIEVRR